MFVFIYFLEQGSTLVNQVFQLMISGLTTDTCPIQTNSSESVSVRGSLISQYRFSCLSSGTKFDRSPRCRTHTQAWPLTL